MKGIFYSAAVFMFFVLVVILLVDIFVINKNFKNELVTYKTLKLYSDQINNILFYSKNNVFSDAVSDYIARTLDKMDLEDWRYFIVNVSPTTNRIDKHIKLSDGAYIDCYDNYIYNKSVTQIVCIGPFGISKSFRDLYNDNSKIKNLIESKGFTVLNISKGIIPLTKVSNISRLVYHPNYAQLLNEGYAYPFMEFGGITGASVNKYKDYEIYPLDGFHGMSVPELQTIINKELCENLTNTTTLKNLFNRYINNVINQVQGNNGIKFKIKNIDMRTNTSCKLSQKFSAIYTVCIEYELSKGNISFPVKRCGVFNITNVLSYYDSPIKVSKKIHKIVEDDKTFKTNYQRSNYEYSSADCTIHCHDRIGYIKYTKERIFYDKITICSLNNTNCVTMPYHIYTIPYEYGKRYSVCDLVYEYISKNGYCDGVEKYVKTYYKAHDFNDYLIDYSYYLNLSIYNTYVFLNISAEPGVYGSDYILPYRYGVWR